MPDITDKIRKSFVMKGGFDRPDLLVKVGQSALQNIQTQFPAQNPMTRSGKEVMTSMKKQYGKEKGKQVFYASINKGKKGSKKWHKK